MNQSLGGQNCCQNEVKEKSFAHHVPVITAFLSSTLNTTATSELSPSSCFAKVRERQKTFIVSFPPKVGKRVARTSARGKSGRKVHSGNEPQNLWSMPQESIERLWGLVLGDAIAACYLSR